MFEPCLRLQNVNLDFVLPSYRTASWRDVFVRKLSGEKSEKPEVLHACRNVNFSVLQGERVAIVGANGAGKTSLCRLIAGFYLPTSGCIERFGHVDVVGEMPLLSPLTAENMGRWSISALDVKGQLVRYFQ